MDWKKITESVLFPHFAVILAITPCSLSFLIYSMTVLGTETIPSYISYVFSFYALILWCVRIPAGIRRIQMIKTKNPYVKRWREDAALRVIFSLYSSLGWNVIYGIFQLWLGFYHHTVWFLSFGIYHLCLGIMRFFLLWHTKKYAPGEQIKREWIQYRACGWVFLFLNVSLTLILFFMIYWNRTFQHHMITAIAMASYTFFAFTVAIINVIRYRKYNSPVFSASKMISLASALVSMLTLESTMLTAFRDDTMTLLQQKWMLGATGGTISVLIVITAIHMILTGTKKLKIIHSEETHESS